MPGALRPAVFLDRDGTLNLDVGYLHTLEGLQLFPFTIDALRLLKRAGFVLVVISNQAGIALGYIEEGFVERAHDVLQRRFASAGATVDGFYFCPHHPMGTVPHLRQDCRCRKPYPGMLEQAAQEKKRGFWSRVFGVGDDKNKDKDAEKRARDAQREQQRELERERKRQRELERELQREREKEEKKRRRNQQ